MVNSPSPIHCFSFTNEAVSHPSAQAVALAATSAPLSHPRHLTYRAADSVVSDTKPVAPESSVDIALFVLYTFVVFGAGFFAAYLVYRVGPRRLQRRAEGTPQTMVPPHVEDTGRHDGEEVHSYPGFPGHYMHSRHG